MNFELVDGFNKRVPLRAIGEEYNFILNHWTEIKVTSIMASKFANNKSLQQAAWGFYGLRRWIDNNIQGRWANTIHLFYFEDPADASYFLMRWA